MSEERKPDTLSPSVGALAVAVADLLELVTIESTTGLTHNTMQEIACVLRGVGENAEKLNCKAVIFDTSGAAEAAWKITSAAAAFRATVTPEA